MTITLSERMAQREEAFRRIAENVSASLRVAMPGIIRSFDPATQTAVVELAIRARLNVDGSFPLSDVDYKPLVDVPVFMPRAGGYVLALPVTAGDECLVVFADRCIDAWFQSGDVQNQVMRRFHDLSDGFALVGIWSQPRAIADYPTQGAQLRNDAGTVKVELTGTTINIVTTGEVNVEAESANVDADDVTIGDATTIDGRVFMAHQHSGVLAGGSNTGGVV